jgi:PAT family beta-lactamase induction signal transducer AmpG
VSLRHKLTVIAGVYVIEGFPMGIFRDFWPVYLREAGASLAWIGLLSGLYLAWSLKPLWSPLIGRFGEYRQWIAAAMVVVALSMVLVPRLDPLGAQWLVFAAIGLLCIASATQDIAIDAYTIGLVDRGEEGQANAVRINAYRIALILAGGGLLLLPNRIGWHATHWVGAAAALAMAAALVRAPRVEVPLAARRDVRGSFRSWTGRSGLPSVLAFVLLYRLGDLAIGPMIKTFWVDRGISLERIALVSTTLGSAATMVGAALGGWIVARFGLGRGLWIVGVLAVASNLGYAGAAAFPELGNAAVYAAGITESFCGGLAAAGFMSYLMRICDRQHAAVQYATLSGLYALPGTLAGSVSGAAVESLGYAPFFALTAVVAAPAFLFLPAARRWMHGAGDGHPEAVGGGG